MLRAGFAVFLLFCSLCFTVEAAEPVKTPPPTWKEPIKRVQALLPDGMPPFSQIPSVWPGRSDESPDDVKAVNNALPGLGTLAPHLSASPLQSIQPAHYQTLGVAQERMIPAIYVEGEGYLPLTHPSIEPFLRPEIRVNPASDPSVVMIPESQLTHAVAAIPTAASTASRAVNVSGNTVLSLPRQDHVEPLVISASSGWSKQTEKYDIHFLSGDCSIRQADALAQGPRAVVWVERQKNPETQTREVTAYLESNESNGMSSPVYVESAPGVPETTQVFDQKWLGRFQTRSSIEIAVMNPQTVPEQEPAIYQRALSALSPEQAVVTPPQFQKTAGPAPQSAAPRYRRIILSALRDNEPDIVFDPLSNDPNRGVLVITNGINVVIEDVQDDLLLGKTVDISADNAVVWMENPARLSNSREQVEDKNKDFELYLEGNIIFRDGPRRIEAHRMYYDAKNNLAYILEGHMETPILGIKGITGHLRLKAEILQQLGDGVYSAKNSLITTSRLGEPTYSLRSKTMTMTEKLETPLFGGEPVPRQLLVGENNYMAARSVPFFYWPWMAADLKDPTFYLKSITYGNSSVYGNLVRTVWDPFQLLNIRNRPSWLDGNVSIAWMEKRGIAHGGELAYSPASFCAIPGPTQGRVRYWGISDTGLDRLGGRRSDVEFPNQYRYRFDWRHRQRLDSLWRFAGPWTFDAQVGKISDRNVINNYDQGGWNSEDNRTTALELQKTDGDSTLSLSAEYALDDFFTNANWLPRLDHYRLGRSLLHDRVTWYAHTRVGYMDYNTASAPYDWLHDGRYFRYLPWELASDSPTNAIPNPATPMAPQPKTINMSGEVFSTRHELDLPFNVGPIRAVPYVLGDFSHWGTDRSGQDVQRFYGQGGLRLNLPFWKVLPNCASRSWYVNGLAHKVDFDAELSYARSDQSMDNLLMTDALDNWALEDFRRRYSMTTFAGNGGVIPMMFDPRYYALRQGMAGNVTAKNMEIADNLTLARFGMTHRFQTKRGPVGNRHIIDWVTLSSHFNYYPEAEQNYGKQIGLIDYDFLWHVGDRFSIFSSGLYDLFDDGQQITRLGATWNRPKRGSFSMMYDQLAGLLQRDYLTMSVSYDMNEKYAMVYSSSFEIRKQGWENLGHNFMFTRTGESFRMLVGASYNPTRDEWGFTFGIEPVFMRGLASRLSSMGQRLMQEQR